MRGVSEQARLVAYNMTVVRRSTTELVQADLLTVEGIVDLQAVLLPDRPEHHGLRTVQNWIGGSDRNPFGADFVPPGPDRVPDLMADLVDYLNGAAHAPLIQVAVVHAQFETDSATARLLARLPEAPVVTATTLEELRHAEILHTKPIERGAKAYIAREVLDLIAVAERALVSTKFDARAAMPNRPVPVLPGD